MPPPVSVPSSAAVEDEDQELATQQSFVRQNFFDFLVRYTTKLGAVVVVGVFGAGLDALVAVDALCRRCLDQGNNGGNGNLSLHADVVRQGGSGTSCDDVCVFVDGSGGGTLEHDAVDDVGGGTTTGRGAVDAATGVDAVDFVGGGTTTPFKVLLNFSRMNGIGSKT